MVQQTSPQRDVSPRRPVLIVTPPGAERDELFEELHRRSDFLVLYAADAAEAERLLGNQEVCALIVAPEVPAAGVSELLATKERLQPGLPLLVIRRRQAEEPAHWAQQGVGILRCPLLPEVLGRTLEVVLGLQHP